MTTNSVVTVKNKAGQVLASEEVWSVIYRLLLTGELRFQSCEDLTIEVDGVKQTVPTHDA